MISSSSRHLRPSSVIFTAALVVGAMTSAAQGQCEVQQLSNPAGEKVNDFGRSVSVFGDVAVVGDPGDIGALGTAYVFRHTPPGSGNWMLEGILRAPKPDPQARFGRAVAVRGNVIIVGAPRAGGPELQSGAAYIFRYDPDRLRWRHEATLTASDGAGGDRLGWSVAIDIVGDLLLIGARDDDNGGVSQAGSAYVFRYDGANWVEEVKLTDPGGQELDAFGFSVSIKGDLAVVGVPGDDGAGLQAGTAFMFRHDGSTWNQEAELTAFDATPNDLFGWSVALMPDVALVGAREADGQNGAAYVFRYDADASAWRHEIKLSASEPIGIDPKFGHSLSLDAQGDTALIGAQGDGAVAFAAGAAYLFRDDGTGWVEVAKLTASDGGAQHIFGTSVAVSDDIGLVGGPRQDVPGKAYLFELEPAAGDLDCDGTVGIIDLLMLLTSWGPCPAGAGCPADLDGDGAVGIPDLLTLLANCG